MKKFPVIKIDETDKQIFKTFKKADFPLKDNELMEYIYFYLQGYVSQILKFRPKGIVTYGYAKISLHNSLIEDYLKCVNKLSDKDKDNAMTYLHLAKQTTEKLNKYIVEVVDPIYMRIMKNYDFMIKTLREAPHFHDAYIIKCEEKGNDVFITFELIADWILPLNVKIYKTKPKYRGKEKRLLITLKFANVKLTKGSFQKEYNNNEWYNFMMDLDYETKSDIEHEFDFLNGELIFSCEYIEFIENN